MSALPRMRAVITGPLDDYTREALRAVVDDAGRGVSIQFEPYPPPTLVVDAPVAAPRPAPKPRGPGMADLIAKVAFETGVSVARITGPSQARADFRARMAVCWAARELLGASSPTIGRALGDRDHSTILHALLRANSLVLSDPAFRMLTGKLRAAMGTDQ